MKKVLKISLGVLFLLILCGTFAFLWYKTRPVKEVYQIVVPQTDTIEKRAVATGRASATGGSDRQSESDPRNGNAQ